MFMQMAMLCFVLATGRKTNWFFKWLVYFDHFLTRHLYAFSILLGGLPYCWHTGFGLGLGRVSGKIGHYNWCKTVVSVCKWPGALSLLHL